jgi:serine phosphatase RsbU (regulator of sigma subunit)
MTPIEETRADADGDGAPAVENGLRRRIIPGAAGAQGPRVARGAITLLLVEDDDGDALLVEDQLAEDMTRARIARARTLAETVDVPRDEIDCVLLDLNLPDASGLNAVAEIRLRFPAIPLIVLTGLDDAAAGIAAVEAGAQDYLVKGKVDGGALTRSIRYAISRRQADDAERELLLAQAQAQEGTRLERGLAPRPMIESDSAWVASCSRAGRSRALLGGDFFDAVETPDGSLRLLVGDVCGHGADEAAVGVSLRSAWRALALAGESASTIVETLQNVLEHERQIPNLFTTLCTLEINSARDRAEMTLAGHPPPVLIADGSVRRLSGGYGGPPIGLRVGEWPHETIALPPGWALLLYTDGIIEGRTGVGSERLGEEGLHELIARYIDVHPTWRSNPDAMLEALFARAHTLNGTTLSDDVAMVLVGAGVGVGVAAGTAGAHAA